MTKQIALTNGGFALVDDADFEWLNEYRWHRNWGYVFGSIDGQAISMHRLLLKCPPGMEVDHRNRNRSDNQRANLRAVTHSDNLKNRGKNPRASSRYWGVTKAKGRRKKWHASLRVAGRIVFLGAYENELEAAQQYDTAARILRPGDAPLNFQ